MAVPGETETSALGAAMAAAVGSGFCRGFAHAAEVFCRQEIAERPRGDLQALLKKRFSLYRELYPQVKHSYETLREVRVCAV